MIIFLDDERFPPNDGRGWTICRSMKDVAKIVEECLDSGTAITFISFDHDLGEHQSTGMDITKFLVDIDMQHGKLLSADFDFYVHSQNPVGKKNIESYLRQYLSLR